MAIEKLRTFPIASADAIACGKDIPCPPLCVDGTCELLDAACFGIASVDADCQLVSDKPCGGIAAKDKCSGTMGNAEDHAGCTGWYNAEDVALLINNQDEYYA